MLLGQGMAIGLMRLDKDDSNRQYIEVYLLNENGLRREYGR